MRVIYLSGVDGAGKSTVRATLARRLRREGARVATLHWPSDSLLGLLPHKSGPTASVLFGLVGYDPTGNREPREDPETTRRPGPEDGPRRAAWLALLLATFWLVLANASLMRLVIAVRYRGADRVVADRSPLDDLVQLEYLGLSPALVSWGVDRLSLARVHVLAVPAGVAIDRDSGPDGPDHPPSYYGSKARLYGRYADREEFHRLDATADPGTLAERIRVD